MNIILCIWSANKTARRKWLNENSKLAKTQHHFLMISKQTKLNTSIHIHIKTSLVGRNVCWKFQNAWNYNEIEKKEIWKHWMYSKNISGIEKVWEVRAARTAERAMREEEKWIERALILTHSISVHFLNFPFKNNGKLIKELEKTLTEERISAVSCHLDKLLSYVREQSSCSTPNKWFYLGCTFSEITIRRRPTLIS